ncbi:MAG TPA: FAD-dependent thymidylate synthase [Solirubrobacteraceae bacterium]|nr:FAD-dependent thymidylate synthase [Solirubrobacteraceae bacterium]
MRSASPTVRLVARPDLDWQAVKGYLDAVGGLAWLDRMMRQNDGAHFCGSEGEALVELGGRLCYRSWEPGLNANVTRVREDSAEYLENILAVRHGSVIEHANYSFVFQDVSRVFTHELVRHRAGAAYSQESMRFVRLTDLPFWFPEWVGGDPVLLDRCLTLLLQMEEHQRWMAEHFGLDDEGVPFKEKKAKTSFMRRFAPDGVATAVLATFNVRSLRWLIEARTDAAAEEEMRLVFGQVAELMVHEAPALFGDFEREEGGRWVPRHSKV